MNINYFGTPHSLNSLSCVSERSKHFFQFICTHNLSILLNSWNAFKLWLAPRLLCGYVLMLTESHPITVCCRFECNAIFGLRTSTWLCSLWQWHHHGYMYWTPVKTDTRGIKPNQGIWWWLRRIEGDSEIHIFSLTQMLELTGFSHTSDFFHLEFTL